MPAKEEGGGDEVLDQQGHNVGRPEAFRLADRGVKPVLEIGVEEGTSLRGIIITFTPLLQAA